MRWNILDGKDRLIDGEIHTANIGADPDDARIADGLGYDTDEFNRRFVVRRISPDRIEVWDEDGLSAEACFVLTRPTCQVCGNAAPYIVGESALTTEQPEVFHAGDPVCAECLSAFLRDQWTDYGHPEAQIVISGNVARVWHRPVCPTCGSSTDIEMWAEDGESPDADQCECRACGFYARLVVGELR